jgi:hypothetical protein
MFKIKVIDDKSKIFGVKKVTYSYKDYLPGIEVESKLFTVVLVCEGLTDVEKAKVEMAAELLERAINSPSFKDFVINFYYEEKKCSGVWPFKRCHYEKNYNFDYSRNLSRSQIYECILDGKEIIGDGKIDHIAQIFVKIDRSFKKNVIGYSYPWSSKWQYTYENAFEMMKISNLAGHIGHEYFHRLGFPDSSYSKSKHAVTYECGYFVARYAGELK